LLVATTPFAPESSWMRRAAGVGGGAFVVLTALLVAIALYGRRPVRFLLTPLALVPGVSGDDLERGAANLVQGLAVFRLPLVALRAVVLTLVSWLVIAFSFWLCMLAVDTGTGLEAALLVVIAVNLSMILPAGPGGIGVFEAATVLALAPFGVDSSRALSYAVLTHAVNLLPLIGAGYVALHLHVRAVRRGVVAAEDGIATRPLDSP
jgi:glycosyltransferase 2 family protein